MNNYFFLILFCLTSGCATIDQSIKEPVDEYLESIAMAEQANAAYTRSDWNVSEHLYVKLAENSPHNPLFWYRLGNIYATTNRINAAIVAYSKSLESDPTNANVWLNLGMVQLKQSAYTFNAMQSQIISDNPLNHRADQILEGILDLLNE